MTERIQKLYIQVVGDDKLNFDSYLAEKFAELIIEECATVIERNLFQGIGWNTSRAVRRHFGIDNND